ncbi:DUF6273 domain-containing protein [Adlercreutzia caecimuris]|uniref:DUF6273 domain-containing protein n=1 Tax=Adlercreutzia caecimuris TaxID=671266 RepID=UPI001C3D00AA|nr:DUF6273 domain-containing protein [Adlercreutzia caecimuris]
MSDLKGFNVNGTTYMNADATARDSASAVTVQEEFDRQKGIAQFKGRSLATTFASEIAAAGGDIYAWLKARAQDGDFTGLRIGDYMDVPITAGANVPAQTVRYMIGAIDPYYQCSDNPMGHHIAFVPSAPVLVGGSKAVNGSYIKWNDTATNNGNATTKEPYLISKLHGWEISDYLPSLPAALRNVLMNYRSLAEQRYGSSGGLTEASGWGWADLGKVWSLSEMEVYGCAVWGSKGYSVGMDCHFPIFDTTASRLIGERVHWWLRSVCGGSASSVCDVTGSGGAGGYSATDEWIRPRPCFLIG